MVGDPRRGPAAAGVAFSCDPVTGERQVVTIELAAGPGDAVVQGAVAPQRYAVRRAGPDTEIERLDETGDAPILEDGAIETLAALVLRVHWALGDGDAPQDVEWAHDGRTFLDAAVAPGDPAAAVDLPGRAHPDPDLVGRQHPGLVPPAPDDGHLVPAGCDRAGGGVRLGPARGVPAAARHAGAAAFRRPALLRPRQPAVEPLRLDRHPAGRHQPHYGRVPARDPGAGREPATRPRRPRPRTATTAAGGVDCGGSSATPPSGSTRWSRRPGGVARSISRA